MQALAVGGMILSKAFRNGVTLLVKHIDGSVDENTNGFIKIKLRRYVIQMECVGEQYKLAINGTLEHESEKREFNSESELELTLMDFVVAFKMCSKTIANDCFRSSKFSTEFTQHVSDKALESGDKFTMENSAFLTILRVNKSGSQGDDTIKLWVTLNEADSIEYRLVWRKINEVVGTEGELRAVFDKYVAELHQHARSGAGKGKHTKRKVTTDGGDKDAMRKVITDMKDANSKFGSELQSIEKRLDHLIKTLP